MPPNLLLLVHPRPHGILAPHVGLMKQERLRELPARHHLHYRVLRERQHADVSLLTLRLHPRRELRQIPESLVIDVSIIMLYIIRHRRRGTYRVIVDSISFKTVDLCPLRIGDGSQRSRMQILQRGD